jgi:uncharacterized membrane protein YraQ (UPF0718 family)
MRFSTAANIRGFEISDGRFSDVFVGSFRMKINAFTLALYAVAVFFLAFSFFKDKKKTRAALLKAWKAFENILPQLLGVFLLISLSLAYLEPDTVGRFLGERSGWLGVAIAAVAGAVTLMPGFVAFPTAALLLRGGAGLMQMAAFVSTIMMVGVVTAPLEIIYFGKKLALTRNALAFAFSFAVAWVIGLVAG